MSRMSNSDNIDEMEDITEGINDADISYEPPLPQDVREFWRKLSPAILSELAEWHEDGDEGILKNPAEYLRISEGIIRVVTKNYTYKKLKQKLATTYDLPILFNGNDPAAVSAIKEDAPPAGSYAFAHKVELKEPLEITIEVDGTDGVKRNVQWQCRFIAVKELYQHHSEEYVICNRVVREVRVWSRLRHERIVPLFGLWMDFHRIRNHADYTVPHPVPVSPWFTEGNMLTYLATRPITSQLTRLTFLLDIASAMAYMHRMDYVHGDLKADNILIKDGHAYISDFGVSRDALRGHTSQMTGSTRNCARERLFPLESSSTIKNAEIPTKMSDVAEFGFVCLEAWTGQAPWDHLNDMQIIHERHAGKNPPKPVTMREDFWLILLDCWELKPERRPTAEECVNAIQEIYEKKKVPTQLTTPLNPDGSDSYVINEDELLKAHSRRSTGNTDSKHSLKPKAGVWTRIVNAVRRSTL